MKHSNCVERFENDVRTAVRRGSKSIEFEGPIKEVAGHFGDLIQEQLDKLSTQPEAEKVAMKRMGSVGQVATQILDCASQRTKGLQRQRLLFWIPAIAPLLFIGAQWQSNAAISHLFWVLLIP
ncbi:MAG: hypothetical protein WCG75_11300, partial [Armatimonadota bacterium]